ncbi:hypothetical protein KIPB_015638, partial [Kipferlia bialata]|eukprot:g15638.t1
MSSTTIELKLYPEAHRKHVVDFFKDGEGSMLYWIT